MEYKIIKNSEDILKIEDLRKKAYNIKLNDGEINRYFVDKLNDGSMIAVAGIIDDEIAGAAYVSNCQSSLYIENVFVLEKYRDRNVASELIKCVIDRKDFFEKHFHQTFTFSKLEPASNELIEFYKKMGYDVPNMLNIMKKRI